MDYETLVSPPPDCLLSDCHDRQRRDDGGKRRLNNRAVGGEASRVIEEQKDIGLIRDRAGSGQCQTHRLCIRLSLCK